MDLLQEVLDYFANTPKEQINKDWEEIERQHSSDITANEFEAYLNELNEGVYNLFGSIKSSDVTSEYNENYDNSCSSIADAA